MRLDRTAQPSVFHPRGTVHPIAERLERASELPDEHPELLGMVSACVAGSLSCGRRGLTCETILRCAVLTHLMGYSYRQWTSCWAMWSALGDLAGAEGPERTAIHAVRPVAAFGRRAAPNSASRLTAADSVSATASRAASTAASYCSDEAVPAPTRSSHARRYASFANSPCR